MTGLIYNKPDDPLDFIDRAIAKIRSEPNVAVVWDMFIENPPPPKPVAVQNRQHLKVKKPGNTLFLF